MQLSRTLKPAREIADDDGVRSRIDLNIAARRQRRAREERRQVCRLGVTERACQHFEIAGQGTFVGELAALSFLIRQHRKWRDAHDRAFNRVPQFVIAQDDVERLIPRHFVQRDVHGALYRLVDDDVEAADVGERPQDGPQIRALETRT